MFKIDDWVYITNSMYSSAVGKIGTIVSIGRHGDFLVKVGESIRDCHFYWLSEKQIKSLMGAKTTREKKLLREAYV